MSVLHLISVDRLDVFIDLPVSFSLHSWAQFFCYRPHIDSIWYDLGGLKMVWAEHGSLCSSSVMNRIQKLLGKLRKWELLLKKICVFYSRWGFAWSGLLQPNLELIRLFVLQREHWKHLNAVVSLGHCYNFFGCIVNPLCGNQLTFLLVACVAK